MRSARIVSQMGSLGLGILILGATMASTTDALASEEATVAGEFRKKVDAYQSGAKDLKGICDSNAVPESLKQRLTKQIDRLLQMPVSEALRDEMIKELGPVISPSELAKVKGLELARVVEYLKRFKAQIPALRFENSLQANKDALKSFHGDVCSNFCASAHAVNLCALTNDEMANVATAVDSSRLAKAFAFVNENVAKLKIAVSITLPKEKKPGTRETIPGLSSAFTFPVGALAGVATGSTGLLTGNPGASTAFVNNAIEGLGKLIVDRAKQESIGWFLDQTGSVLCGDTKWQQTQIENYFTPSLCTLASKKRLGGFGTGGTLLESLKTSFTNDVRGWPGAIAGLTMGSVYWSERGIRDEKPGDMLHHCSTPEACPDVHAIRIATQQRVTNIFGGQSAAKELEALGVDFDRHNIYKDTVAKFSSKATQMIACGMVLPREIQRIHTLFDNAFEGSSAPDRLRHRAAVLAALLKSQPCFRILGRGHRDSANGFDPKNYAKTLVVGAIESPDDIERFSTLFRLHDKFEVHLDEMINAASAMQDAAKDYEVAVKAATEALRKLQSDPPSVSKFDLKDAKAAEKFVNDIIRAIKIEAQRKHIGAAIALSKSVITLGQATIGFIKDSNNQMLVPGFFPSQTTDTPFDAGLQEKLQRADEALVKIQTQLGALEAALTEDWATLISQVFSGLKAQTKVTDSAYWDSHLDVRHWGEIEDHIAQQLSFVIAILQAKDGDEMARALDTLASPPGGWRIKTQEDQFVVSITAHPGLFVGGELRHGAYGVVHENFKYMYGVPPVLALPVGLEFAWGQKHSFPSPFAIFLSVLDPAAFLQYDVNKDAKLPGPSAKTALAPGLGLRFGIKDTPFSVMPFATYRPGFRQWDPALGGTGASVLQLGVLASVDVTLFQMYAKP